jgi:hypothetical protein
MAVHEAGHLVVTHLSHYFGLRDPAVQIDLDGPFAALSGVTRVRDTSAPEHHLPSTREYVRIAFAGKAAEEEFLLRQSGSGPRLIPNPDGANHDIEKIDKTLGSMGITLERDGLWKESTELVRREWATVQLIAQEIFLSQEPALSRERLLRLLPPKA